MKLIKIYDSGIIINKDLYTRLKILDKSVFVGCGNEFKKNRGWWVIVVDDVIIAYCGCSFSEGVCIFVRAWVHKPHRGKGIQKKMIKARLREAKLKNCTVAVTYTINANYPSANNLLDKGFRLFQPIYSYAGKDVLYFRIELKK